MNPAKRLGIFTRLRAANPHPRTELRVPDRRSSC